MISSVQNSKIKNIVSYVKKSSNRKKDKVFIVEGMKMIKEIPQEYILEVYASKNYMSGISDDEKSILENIRCGYEEVTDEVFDKMSDTKTPQGLLALVRQKEYEIEDLFKPPILKGKKTNFKPLILILEDVQDPGNIGTIVRMAEGAGVSGIIMTRGCADIYSPKVVRSTMGAIFREPFIYTDDIIQTISFLKEKKIKIYAAHLKGKKSYEEIDMTFGLAFMIGNEGKGLKDETSNMADEYMIIPMFGKVESLNAAISASILSFEASRQRRIKA